ncbi:hypothetical protein PTSG_02171 [Salpingoeca rosetta]|uniref:Uncharacterized protein n=1 Tax=Salpingoeca rosetta (strain ATCC 50818 / BSB-021) TaxID=946362 RepID=F2U1F0_SALR5|nr:uncharacterized protein PTSG_02171 [Salpingoeca rosetta]EGD81452.1 hypothetical protein PTSG_02171 [Salpingoeca rosetta]|eukprot:XP_004996656.1 hypothetical protein PTSG_02171 [Salpingoeca rosetta]
MAEDKGMSKQPGALRSFIAGGVGGVALVIVGHPLDTIKVRLQNMTHVPGKPPQYSGLFDCARQTVTKEGFFGLYKGVAAPLAGVAPMFALCFLGYSYGKKLFCDEDAIENRKLGQLALAGATSALFTTPIMAPGERVKCLLQTQNAAEKPKYNGTMDAFKQLYKEGGLRNVNRGLIATFARDAVGSAVYFSGYEVLKLAFTAEGERGPSVPGLLLAGGLAGMGNWAVCLPIDTVKTRFQVAPNGRYSGYLPVLADIIKTDGVGALFRGFSAVMARAFPANAACFVGYEFALWLTDRMGME